MSGVLLEYERISMKVYNSLEEYNPNHNGTGVALGFFDGVHRGHRAVIGSCADEKGEYDCVVLTFRESPARLMGRNALLLTTNDQKAELIADIGADAVIFADFGALKELSPEDFVIRILRDRLNAKRVYCGFNYRFGRGGAGDIERLRELCAKQGIAVVVKEPVFCDNEQVSSSLIRQLIADGEIEKANVLLGYRYAVEGEIDSGNHLGSTMGFPTVNIPIGDGLTVPKYGVYASDIVIDGVRYKGATNIGVHPTVGAHPIPLCETFLLNFGGGDLYGKKAVCELKAFVREERHFDSIEELTAQIKKDCEAIKKM